jgi:hypothetical protein
MVVWFEGDQRDRHHIDAGSAGADSTGQVNELVGVAVALLAK